MSWDIIGGPLKRADWRMAIFLLATSDIMASIALLRLLPDWLTG